MIFDKGLKNSKNEAFSIKECQLMTICSKEKL
jgi:hypothetical protein